MDALCRLIEIGSGEEDFKNLSKYFCYFKISEKYFRYFKISEKYFRYFKISEKALLLNKLESPSPKDALCQLSLVEIGPVVLEKKMKMLKVYRQTDTQTDDGRQVIIKAHLSFQLR